MNLYPLIRIAVDYGEGCDREQHRGEAAENNASVPPDESIHRRDGNRRIKPVQRAL